MAQVEPDLTFFCSISHGFGFLLYGRYEKVIVVYIYICNISERA